MSVCDRCGKDSSSSVLNDFGYNILCMDCHDELVENRDYRSVEEMETTDCIHEMNGQQVVKNFVKVFSEYKEKPSYKLYDVLWRLYCMACHEDHTASAAISAICKWQDFDFYKESKKWGDR